VRPSKNSSSLSSKTVSSEDEVIEDDKDRAGVDVGGRLTLARASACETATRYDEAEAMGDGVDFFLNIEGVGDDLVKAIGEGIPLDVGHTQKYEWLTVAGREDVLKYKFRYHRPI
jgi:hypothetical protein